MPLESNFERTGRHLVLCVDDDEDAVETVREMLERALPVEVRTACSGEEALRTLQERDFDLILCDYHMPGIDGLEVLRRARDLSPTTARAMITSATDFHLAVEAINDGAITAFFPKPLDAATLRDKVRAALDARHRAIVKERGLDQAARVFRREVGDAGKDIARPFTGSLVDR